MSRAHALAGVAAAALTLAALTVLALRPTAIAPGGSAWGRIVRGPTADGILYPGVKAVIALPDLPRARPREVVIDGDSLGDSPAVLSVSVDGAAPVMVALDARRAARVAIPSADHRGVRLDVAAERGAPPARLRAIRVAGAWPSVALLVIVSIVTGLAVVGATAVEKLDTRTAPALAPLGAAAAVAAVAVVTGALSVGWPRSALAIAMLLAVAGVLAAARAGHASRAPIARAALLVAALAFGGAARWLLAPSAGSWDMEYWRAWTESTITRGVAGAYGPALANGALLPTLRGDEPLWMVSYEGRRFPIDYPPLALAAWRGAAAIVPAADPASWNVALKLPAIAGDVLAVAILLLWWPAGRAGARAAALYWALPASWLSSATLGYLDGAYAPFVLVAAIAAGAAEAGARRAALAGAALAVAALIKPTALVAAPAIAVALLAPRRILTATVAGLGVLAVAVVPLALAGTLGAAIAHILPILYQERLSGGYANAWWLLGAALSGDATSVPYVRIDAAPFPVRAMGVIAFAGAAFLVCRALARARGTVSTVAACAALFAAYGVFGVGVHVNHPHPLVLLFLAAGLGATAWRWPAWTFIHGYALNILLLEQLGRLAGPRYGSLEKAGGVIERMRFGAGFDLTLALAAAHVAALGILLARAASALRSDALSRPQVDDPQAVHKLDERVKYDLK